MPNIGLKIKGRSLRLPVIQGGMGVGVSLGRLAGSVAACGAMGVISSANVGFNEPDFWRQPLAANMRTLEREIRRAKGLACGRGLVGVNIMVATTQYPQAVKCSIEAGVDAIICGAGLPLELPGLAAEAGHDVLLAPIVSSGKAARSICRRWDRDFGREPDFVVIEGAEAGGHLGFARDQLLSGTTRNLHQILRDVKAELVPFEQKYGCEIPVVVAGGVFDAADTAAYLAAGAAGVQVATRFIATHECDGSDAYKQIIIAAKPEDARLVQSPVGMPGRALWSPLLERLAEAGRLAPERCAACIKSCRPQTTPYCITKALIEAVRGNWQDGLFFCGSNVGRVNKLLDVEELLRQLVPIT